MESDRLAVPRLQVAGEGAVLAAGRQLQERFEGWMVADPDRRTLAVRIAAYPEVDISVVFDWSATAAEVTERVWAAMEERSKRRAAH
jgi:hypothetical protein